MIDIKKTLAVLGVKSCGYRFLWLPEITRIHPLFFVASSIAIQAEMTTLGDG